MTLSRAILPAQGLATQVMLVLAGTALIAVSARISIGWPVPMTMQMLAILLVGFAYGAKLGTITLLAYLAEGALGLPVFAGGNAGIPYMMGATGGFLIGFVLTAFVAGLAADMSLAKYLVGTLAAALVASALVYLPGLAWPAAMMGKSWDVLWTHWMSPFLVADAIKATIAALMVTAGWTVLRKR